MIGPIHIRLDQHRLDPVALLPIQGHLRQHQPVTLRSQVGPRQSGPNQKTRQADDQSSVVAASFDTPADPLIPALQMKGGRSKAKGAHDPPITFHHIAQLGSDQRTATRGMFPRNQPIPNQVRLILVILDEPQAQAGKGPLAEQLGQHRQGLAIIQEPPSY